MKKLITLLLVLTGIVSSASAETATTVYYAVHSRLLVGNSTVEINVNRKGDGNDWMKYQMTNTGKTYYGLSIYKAEFTDLYDGLGCIQFLVDNVKWDQAFGEQDWTSPDVYNGKIWVHIGSWVDYADDDAITPLNITYHVQTSDWGDHNWIPYKAYEYKGNTNTTWTGNDTSANPWNNGWYDYTVVYPFETIIFNDGDSNGGNGHQTGDIAIDNSQSEYWYTYTKNGEGNGVTTSISKPDGWLDDYERTGLTVGNYGTICLPFDATISGADLYEITSKVVEDNTLKGINIRNIGTSLTGGQAYIFKATETTLTATSTGDAKSAAEGEVMVGNLSSSNLDVPDGKHIIKGGKICEAGEGVYVGQYKAYVDLENIGAGARGLNFMSFDGEGGTTGVEELKNSNTEELKSYFNLAGQRVAQPTKGLYIVNGKKVIMK